MLTERCLLHAQMARNKAYALHTPCAPAKSARNNSCLVLIQLQAICLLHSHCNYYTSAFSAALGSTKPLSFVVKIMLCSCEMKYQALLIPKWCRGETGLGVVEAMQCKVTIFLPHTAISAPGGAQPPAASKQVTLPASKSAAKHSKVLGKWASPIVSGCHIMIVLYKCLASWTRRGQFTPSWTQVSILPVH